MNYQCIELICNCFFPLVLGFLGFYYTKQQNKLNGDNTEKELFRDFNIRYSNLNNKLNELKSADMKSITEDPLLYDAAMEFFNLCAEEYYWKKKF